MKAVIRDQQTLLAIRPGDLVGYLRASRWQEVESADAFSVWRKDSSEVIVPLNTAFHDFALRMGEVLAALQDMENRSQIDILTDLQTQSADRIRIRLQGTRAIDGTIPIEDGVSIIAQTRELLLASACAAVEQRPVFFTRKPPVAMEYLKSVRLGQTERGSYVVNVISKVPPFMATEHGDGEMFPQVQEPFPRRATRMLAQSIKAVKRASERAIATATFDMFQQAVLDGVSANLCEALASIATEQDSAQDLEIGFAWSKSRPAPEDTATVLTLPRESIPVIKEAARIFRERAPVDDFRLVGPVVRLARPVGTEHGTITVFGFVDERPKNIAVQLEEREYALAIRAHENRIPISCVGELVREGPTYRLADPRHFTLQEQPELE